MGAKARTRRDFEALEKRRKRAAKLFAGGETQASVAHRLDVTRQSVSRWYKQWEAGDVAALRGAGRAGRKPLLDAKDLDRLDSALREGAKANGFRTELWTLNRVATVIEKLTGVHYHPGHVWKVLQSMDWSPQRPAKRALERNVRGRRKARPLS